MDGEAMDMNPEAQTKQTRGTRRKNRCMFQDKRGRWWLDYYTPDGRRKRKLCGSFDAAKADRLEIEHAKKHGTYADENSAPAFSVYSEKYLEEISSKKDSCDREGRLMKNLVSFFGTKRLSKIKRTQVREYRTARLKDGVSNGTVNREMALLRHMFNVAIDDGVVSLNPARGGPGLKALKEKRRTRFLEMKEINSLLVAIDNRIVKNSDTMLKANAKKAWQYLHAIVVTALHTGMRKGEILSLRWSQINWEKQHFLLEDTKNDEPRRVPIDSILVHELAEHRGRVKNEEIVFPSFDNDGNVVPLGDVKGAFGRVLKDAGIVNFRFHDLRQHVLQATT